MKLAATIELYAYWNRLRVRAARPNATMSIPARSAACWPTRSCSISTPGAAFHFESQARGPTRSSSRSSEAFRFWTCGEAPTAKSSIRFFIESRAPWTDSLTSSCFSALAHIGARRSWRAWPSVRAAYVRTGRTGRLSDVSAIEISFNVLARARRVGNTEATKVDFAIGRMVNPPHPGGLSWSGTRSPSRLDLTHNNSHITGD